MKLESWLKENTGRLSSAGISSPRLDCLLLLENVLKLSRDQILAKDQLQISNSDLNKLAKLISRRENRQPLAYLIGTREFYGLSFTVTPEVLIPRPETEILVEYAINNCPKSASVVEIGTGSGCIAVALSKNRPDLSILATDASESALKVAKSNIDKHKVNVKLHTSNIFEYMNKSGLGKYDVVLANLPYVPVEARRQPEIEHEPDIALYGGVDGLDLYRKFFDQLPKNLHKNGWAAIEASPTQYKSLKQIAKSNGYLLEPISEYIYLAKSIVQ